MSPYMDTVKQKLLFIHDKSYTQTFCRVSIVSISKNITSKLATTPVSTPSKNTTTTTTPASFNNSDTDVTLFLNHIIPLLDRKYCTNINLTLLIPPSHVILDMSVKRKRELEIQIGIVLSSLSYVRHLASLTIKIGVGCIKPDHKCVLSESTQSLVQLCLGNINVRKVETMSISVTVPNCHACFNSIVAPALTSFTTHFTNRCLNDRMCGYENGIDAQECNVIHNDNCLLVQGLEYNDFDLPGTAWNFNVTTPGIFHVLPYNFFQLDDQKFTNLSLVTIHCDHIIDTVPRCEIDIPSDW